MRFRESNVKKKGKGVKGKFSASYPLLLQRSKEWGFDIPTGQPRGTVCMVWRFPPIRDHKIPGTDRVLMIPDEHESPHVKGVLIAAGAKALEALESDGITLGHIVTWKRFAGEEMNDSTPEALKGMRVNFIQVSDILMSDDLRSALETGKLDYTKDEKGKINLLASAIPGQRKQKAISAKKEKLLRLASDPAAAPAERATAKKLAAAIH